MAHSPNPPQLAAGAPAAPYPAEDFAELLTQNPDQAFALLGEMTSEQREAQAEAYLAWLGHFGLHASLALVREAWGIIAQQTLKTHSG